MVRPAQRRELVVWAIEAYQLRARVALAASAQVDAKARRPFFADARRMIRRIGRERGKWGVPLMALLEAAIATQSGKLERAVAQLRAAVQGFDDNGMRLYAAAARHRLGTVLGGDEGKALHAGVEAWMAEEEVADPAKMIAMLAPGF